LYSTTLDPVLHVNAVEDQPTDLVRCSECGREVSEEEAQAARWGYWSDGVGELYPYCAECAEREFGNS
jgi:hypothetical protein